MKWRRIGEPPDGVARLKQLPPHEILGVSPDASLDQVKTAYRALVRLYHPDAAGPFMRRYNEEVTTVINGAYSAMCDRQRMKP